MKNNSLTIIIIVVAIAVGFYIGMKYQQSNSGVFARQFSNNNGRGGMMFQNGSGGNRMGFRPVNGEIISSDDKSITVKMQDGTSRIVLLSDKTSINKASTALKSDLKTGEKVAVFGQENSDGSVTASSIQLNPIQIQRNENTVPNK